MSVQWSRCIVGALTCLLFGGLAGCAAPVIQTKPDTFNVPADFGNKLRAGGSVALINSYPAESKVRIWVYGDSGWFGDLRQFTDTAMTMIERELRKRSVTADSTAAKSVTLRVYDVSASPGWVIKAELTLEAQYGDGTKSTIRTTESSSRSSKAGRSVTGRNGLGTRPTKPGAETLVARRRPVSR